MISFRNHVVTLVVVFLALAVGIVLGGGPLSEVGRSAPASASPAQKESVDVATFGDAFAQAGAERLYAQGLAGRSVTVVTMPGADEDVVSALSSNVQRAGGTVTTTFVVKPSLLNPSDKSLVDTLGSQLMTQIGGGAEESASTYVRAGQLLSYAIATPSKSGSAADEDASSIREAFAGAELTANPKGTPKRSPLVLVVLGDDVDDDILAGLLSGLARRAVGVVAVGDTESGANGDLAALRASSVEAEVTTVDGVEHNLGRVTAGLALIRALAGNSGAYGASGSDGAVPLG